MTVKVSLSEKSVKPSNEKSLHAIIVMLFSSVASTKRLKPVKSKYTFLLANKAISGGKAAVQCLEVIHPQTSQEMPEYGASITSVQLKVAFVVRGTS